MMNTWSYFYLILLINLVCSQDVYQSKFTLSIPGTLYEPANKDAQYIISVFVSSFMQCAIQCNWNSKCRVFDYGAMQSNECRLFEGDIGVLGSIGMSSTPDSNGGLVQLDPSLFAQYGQTCSSACTESRYLQCNNGFVCDCMPHTYWDTYWKMCLPQMTVAGAWCQFSANMCREDLNLTCSAMGQCEGIVPASTTDGVNIADQSTIIEGDSTNGFDNPIGVIVYGEPGDESLIVADSVKQQIVLLKNISSHQAKASVLIHNGTDGTYLSYPSYLYLDKDHQYDLYITDNGNNRILLLSSMQITDPLPQNVAGTFGAGGLSASTLSAPNGVTLDNQNNILIADTYGHRIMLWSPSATSGTIIIGTGDPGTGSTELNYPTGVFFDKQQSTLYVADNGNNRIQLLNMTAGAPYVGITVAGGNGAGTASNQLNQPSGVWVSPTTGAIYISDTGNNRIQRWNFNATDGTTVAGDPNGGSGSTAARLNSPTGLTINSNETYLYVSDTGNKRIQRFALT
ncbi:unnamed protein product [Adineta ricciae]|uniref:Apple domain-containing protein n=1 Tax=Adineta ricciae TaxID=249248 RepID=A0A814RRA5_ADIRI|nr:unnamed protein product [Adineta ricciae]